MPRRYVFLDSDIIIYKACFASEQEIYWGDGDWTLSLNEGQARTAAYEMIDQLRLDLSIKKNQIQMCFSNGSSFRKDFFPEYKANRKKLRKPLGLNTLKRWLMGEFKSIVMDNLEADDIIGISMTRPNQTIKIAASSDKDLRTIPGTHWNFDKQELSEISKEEADYNFYLQVLTGDSADNYQGCPGVGIKTAEKILASSKNYPYSGPKDYWETVTKAYRDRDCFGELTMARLARILRWSDYNWKTGIPVPWLPEKK